ESNLRSAEVQSGTAGILRTQRKYGNCSRKVPWIGRKLCRPGLPDLRLLKLLHRMPSGSGSKLGSEMCQSDMQRTGSSWTLVVALRCEVWPSRAALPGLLRSSAPYGTHGAFQGDASGTSGFHR